MSQTARTLYFLHRRSAQSGPKILRRLRHAPSSAKFKILFLGRDEFSCIVLRELHASKDVWKDICIATNPDEKTGRRGSYLSVSPLKILGERLQLPVHTIPPTRKEFKAWQLPGPFSFSVDKEPPPYHIIITASFGRILTSSMLDKFAPSRRLNVHPSLLPAYRGPAPIQHAILRGEEKTGVSIIQMLRRNEGIDAGAIWGLTQVPLYHGVKFSELRHTLGHVGGRLLVSVLRQMKHGRAKSIAQEHLESAPHAPAIQALDSVVNFNSMSAEAILRRHQAISHQRPLITCLPTEKIVQLHSPYILDAGTESLSEVPGTATFEESICTLVIRCADGSVLSVPLVKQEGKSMMEARDWWNGVRGLGLVHGRQLKFLNDFGHLLKYE